MPRFNKVLPPEELPSTDSPSKQKMASTRSNSKHAAVSSTKPVAKAKILPPEDDDDEDLESLVEEEAAREEDPDVIQETRDAATHAEGDRKVIGRIVKAPVVGSEEDQCLLEEVATNWTAGKKNLQTARCESAIRNCLLQGMKQVTIADYVAYHAVPLEDQAFEVERIRRLANRINKSLKESGDGAASKVVPYQRNRAVPIHDDALQKSVEAALASLSISSMAEGASDATQSQGNPNLMTTDQFKNEQHWMAMWKDVRVELKKLREDLKVETDEEVVDELKSDIDF